MRSLLLRYKLPLALGAILLLALLLRLYSLQPTTHIDETLHLATALGTDGLRTHVYFADQIFWYHRFKPLTLLLSWFIGRDLMAAKLLIVFLGLLSTIFIYLIGKRFSRRIGLIAALLWAISPLAISINSYVRDYSFFVLANLVIVYILIRAVEVREKGISWQKNTFAYLFGLSTVIIAAFFLYDRQTTMSNIVVIYIAAFAMAIAQILKLRFKQYNYNLLATVCVILAMLAFGIVESIVELAGSIGFDNIPNKFWSFFLAAPAFLELNAVIPVILLLTLITAISYKKYLSQTSQTVVWSIFIGYLFLYAVLFARVFIVRYTVYLLPWLLIVIAVGIYVVYEQVKRRPQSLSLLIVLAAVTGAVYPINLNSERFAVLSDSQLDYDFTSHRQVIEDLGFTNTDTIVSSAPWGTMYYSPIIDPIKNNLHFYEYWKADSYEKLVSLTKQNSKGLFIFLIDHNTESKKRFGEEDVEGTLCYLKTDSGFLFYGWGELCGSY